MQGLQSQMQLLHANMKAMDAKISKLSDENENRFDPSMSFDYQSRRIERKPEQSMKRMGRPTEPLIEKQKTFNAVSRDESMADVLVELDKAAAADGANKRPVSHALMGRSASRLSGLSTTEESKEESTSSVTFDCTKSKDVSKIPAILAQELRNV